MNVVLLKIHTIFHDAKDYFFVERNGRESTVYNLNTRPTRSSMIDRNWWVRTTHVPNMPCFFF